MPRHNATPHHPRRVEHPYAFAATAGIAPHVVGATTAPPSEPAWTHNGTDDDAVPATDVRAAVVTDCGSDVTTMDAARRRLREWPTDALAAELARRGYGWGPVNNDMAIDTRSTT